MWKDSNEDPFIDLDEADVYNLGILVDLRIMNDNGWGSGWTLKTFSLS